MASSRSFAEALRHLGMCATGGGYLVLKKYVGIWGISTDHFDSRAASREALRRAARSPTPLAELLVDGRAVNSHNLKERLYREGVKARQCELCGQGEEWRGRHMSLILDHVNGQRLDNRLENLRIVCPNCNATLATHCGRNKLRPGPRSCQHCDETFQPGYAAQRFCSRACGRRWERSRDPRPETRRVERPPPEQLLAEVAELGWSGTGRKYGVSDNAIRKWVRAYEAEARAA